MSLGSESLSLDQDGLAPREGLAAVAPLSPRAQIKRGVLDLLDGLEVGRVGGLESVWERMRAMPWAPHTLSQLVQILTARMKRLPQGDEEPNDAYICRLVEGIGADPAEALLEFPQGLVVVYDLKGYSKFQRFIDPVRRRQQDEAFHQFGLRVCREHGVSMLQAPAGDKMVFYLEGVEDRNRVLRLFKDLMERPVPTGMTEKEIVALGLSAQEYPGGNFTASIGAAQAGDKELFSGVVTGPIDSDQGGTILLGHAYVRALHNQGKAGGNQICCDETLTQWLGYGGLVWGVSSKANEVAVVTGVKALPVSSSSVEVKEGVGLPSDPILARAALMAAGHALHQRGSLSEFAASIREGVGRQVDELGISNNLGPTTLFLVIGEEADMGTRPEAFISALNASFRILAQPKYRRFFFAKADEHFLVLQTRAHPEETKDLLLDFFADLDAALLDDSVQLPLVAGGVARDEMMTSTTYHTFGGAFARDGASPGYVESARLAKADDPRLPRIRVAFSFTQAGGVPGEHMSLPTKGGPILLLGLEPRERKWQVRELVEAEGPKQALEAKLAQLRQGGNIIRIAPSLIRTRADGSPNNELMTQVLRMGGLGTSAIARHLEQTQAQNSQRLEPLGNGSMPVTRALLVHLARMKVSCSAPGTLVDVNGLEAEYLSRPEAMLEAELDGLITSELEWLEEPLWFTLDQNHLSDTDRRHLQRFFDSVRGRDVALVHTLEEAFEGEKDPVWVGEKTAEGMRAIIFSQRPDFIPEFRERIAEPLRAALEAYLHAHPELPHGPRLAFRLAEKMRVVGHQVVLPEPDRFTIGQREAGVRIESTLHSPSARKLLSLLAVVGTYVPGQRLEDIAHRFADLPPETSQAALSILIEHGFIRQTEDGRLKVVSKDVQVAAELMHDAFIAEHFRAEISQYLLNEGVVEQPIEPELPIEVTAGNLFDLSMWWEHELRCTDVSSRGLELTHALGMYFYRQGDVNAATKFFDRFFERVSFRHLGDAPQVYLDMARVYVESGVLGKRQRACEIYDHFEEASHELADLEIAWYRLYRLPTVDPSFFGTDLLVDPLAVERLKDPEKEESIRLLKLVEVLKSLVSTSPSESTSPAVRTVHRALRVEWLYRRFLLELKHVKPELKSLDSLIQEASVLVQEFSEESVNEEGGLIVGEADATAKRLMSGIMKLIGESQKDVPLRLGYLKKSAALVRETLGRFRSQARPDFEQMREASYGYFITQTTYFYTLIKETEPSELAQNIEGHRAEIRQLQKEVGHTLDQFLRDGAPLDQRGRILQCMENAYYVEVQLEAKCQLANSDLDRVNLAVSHYKWAHAERAKIGAKGDLDMLKTAYALYRSDVLTDSAAEFEAIQKRRPSTEEADV